MHRQVDNALNITQVLINKQCDPKFGGTKHTVEYHLRKLLSKIVIQK